LTNNADRFRKLGPPSLRASVQLRHLQKASGYAFAPDVPRNVSLILQFPLSWFAHFGGIKISSSRKGFVVANSIVFSASTLDKDVCGPILGRFLADL